MTYLRALTARSLLATSPTYQRSNRRHISWTRPSRMRLPDCGLLTVGRVGEAARSECLCSNRRTGLPQAWIRVLAWFQARWKGLGNCLRSLIPYHRMADCPGYPVRGMKYLMISTARPHLDLCCAIMAYFFYLLSKIGLDRHYRRCMIMISGSSTTLLTTSAALAIVAPSTTL